MKRHDRITKLIADANIRGDSVVSEPKKFIDHETQKKRVKIVESRYERLNTAIPAIESITEIGCKPPYIDRHIVALSISFNESENQFRVALPHTITEIIKKRISVSVTHNDDVDDALDNAVRDMPILDLLQEYRNHVKEVLDTETAHLAWLEEDVDEETDGDSEDVSA